MLGAYGHEFSDIIINTTYLNEKLELKAITNKEQGFTYRNSVFKDSEDIIISTTLQLKYEDKEKIKNKMDENIENRKSKQPLDFPNAGSIFKRKNGVIVSEIIDKCGLKGYNIGDAEVSKKHAGFIVNKGNATAKDVLDLIEYIKNVVKEKYKLDIDLEIKIFGE